MVFIKKDFLISLIFIVSILFVASCDCVQRAKGVVLDKKSKKPIDSVYIHKIGKDDGTYSDQAGQFEIRTIDGGLFGCPVLNVAFVKDGYSTTIREFSGDSSVIYLERMPQK